MDPSSPERLIHAIDAPLCCAPSPVTGQMPEKVLQHPRPQRRILSPVEAATLAGALAAVLAGRPAGDRLRQVIARSSFLVNALPVRREAHEETVLDDGATIEVLPPFAGG